MNTRSFFIWSIVSMMTLVLFSLTLSAEPKQRENVLAKHYPEGFANIPPESQKQALKYVTSWMSVFSTLRISGLKKQENLKRAYEQELLPLILPLKGGTKFERDAFEAGTKIYDAMSYLGSKMAAEAAFDDVDMNALIRYKPGNEKTPSQLSEGIGELLYDYFQMVAPDMFEQAQKQIKAQQQ